MKSYPKYIEIGEHKVPLPPLPKDKSDILFIDNKPGDAYWQRVPFPDIWYDYNPETKIYQKNTDYNQDGTLISLSEEDSNTLHRLLKQDLNRRMKGVHAKIGDQIVWIAPDYYHNLQWCQMKDLPEKYGNFRWVQNDVLILWWAVRTLWKEWCAGLLLPKAKKTGVTQIAAGAFCNEATWQEGFEMGAASKEFEHVRDVFMAYFFHSFDNLPYIIQPDVRKRNLSEIIFGTPTQRVGSKGKPDKSREVFLDLNTRMKGYKTKSNCFDGPVLKRGFIDELPKWWESSSVHPDTVLTKNVEAVKLQQKINGHLLVGSYMPELDDAGFHEFAEWVKKSKLKTVNAITGRTNSNMITWAMTGVDSYESCFDKKTGKCDKPKAYYQITEELNSKVKLSDKMAFRRQYPRDENDMFDSGGRGTIFDNIRLARFHRKVDEMLESGATPWKYATVHWSNKEWDDGLVKRPPGKFCPVNVRTMTDADIMEAKHENAELRIHWPGDLSELDAYFNQVIFRNSRHDDDDALCPLPDSDVVPLVGSWDPVDYVLKRDVIDGSTNGGYFGWLHDSLLNAKFKRVVTRKPLIEYYFRHEDPDDDYENLVKIILLLGCYVVVESNKKWVVTRLKKDGLHHFLLLRYPDGSIRPYQIGEEASVISASQESINDYVRSIKRMWAEPKNEGDPDYMELTQSTILYKQAMNFDTTDTKRFDMLVAYGWWCLGLESFALFREEQEDNSGYYSSDTLESTLDKLINL